MNDAPKLLIEWSSRWDDFKTAVGPAFSRSPEKLAGEAATGLFPYRGILVSWGLEIFLLVAVIVLPGKLQSLSPYVPPTTPKYDVIYYTGDELPQTEDAGGAQAGRTGEAGGSEAKHRSQTIKVSRGSSLSEKVVDAPKLKLPTTNLDVANLLALHSIPGPAPAEGLQRSLPSATLPQMNAVAPTPDVGIPKLQLPPSLVTGVAAPMPSVSRDKMRNSAALAAQAVPPAPGDLQREVGSSSVPVARTTEIVPPPISAPVRDADHVAKLTLPAPNVVAPPPSQVQRELSKIGSSGSGDVRSQVVPPPVQSASGSLGRMNAAVGGFGSSNDNVVAPPSQSGDRSLNRNGTGSLIGNTNVVAPPSDSGNRAIGGQNLGGVLSAANVVPPPPTLGGQGSANGDGTGKKGSGRGSPFDLGSSVAPPGGGGGSGGGSGIVLSNKPGSAVGVPGAGAAGSLAMSPAGGDKPGLGGSGGGTGIGHGTGPGSGLTGSGSGAGREGGGHGSDPNAHNGISPYPGPGGAGKGTNGTPAVPGVSVQGGNTITLPSFGSNGDPNGSAPGRSSVANNRKGPDIQIVATPRSGGGFNQYGALKGDRNYTLYIGTSVGTVVMQYADPASVSHPYAEDLSAPDPLHAELPAGVLRVPVTIACILNREGVIKSAHVLQSGDPDTAAKIMAALTNWKFRPALRGDQPVEVNAILGFNTNTD